MVFYLELKKKKKKLNHMSIDYSGLFIVVLTGLRKKLILKLLIEDYANFILFFNLKIYLWVKLTISVAYKHNNVYVNK